LHTKLIETSVFPGRLVKRLNRFTVEVNVNSKAIKAHLTNTGRLEEYIVRGKTVLLTRITAPKLKYRIIAVEDEDAYAIIDTLTQAKAFEYAFSSGLIERFRDCRIIAKNPRIYGSVLDYIIECSGVKYYVEMKSAVLKGPDREAMYPDCPSLRGRRHIKTLMEIVGSGKKGLLIFVAGFPGARCVKPYEEGDPQVARLMREAYESGVEIMGVSIYMSSSGDIYLENADLPICGRWLDSFIKHR